jgi:hypothetical protein
MKARDNPFAVDRVLAVRYQCAEGDIPTLVARLEQLNYRAAIVGGHGTGKTTLLEDLEPYLAGLGFRLAHLRLDAEHRRLPWHYPSQLSATLEPCDFVCLDGAEQFDPVRWMLFRRHTRWAGGLLITSHHSGLLPTLIECTTSPTRLERIISQLAPKPSLVAAPTAAELFTRHRGNLRNALRELYDVYAEQ